MDAPRVPKWMIVVGLAIVAGCGFLSVGYWLSTDNTAATNSAATGAASKDKAEYLDPRALAGDPKAHVGRNIYLQGESNTVDQKGDHTWLQLMSLVRDRDFVTESIIVEMRPKDSAILKSECYRVYGVVKGTTKVKLLLTGAEQEVPLVSGYAVESAPRGASGIGCVTP